MGAYVQRWMTGAAGKDVRLLWRWFRYFRPYRGALAGAAALLLLSTALQLATPLMTGFIVDRILVNREGRWLHAIVALLAAATLAYLVANLARSYVLLRVKVRVALSMHQRLIRHLHRLSFTYTSRKETGYLASRVIDDPGTVYDFVTGNLLTIFQNAVTFLVALGVLLWLSWQTALVALLALPVYLLVGAAYVGRLRELGRRSAEASAERSRVLFETLSGMATTNACGAEAQMLRRFFTCQTDVVRTQIAQFMVGSQVSFIRGGLASLGPILVLWFGGMMVLRGRLTVGQLVAFGGVFGYLFNSAQYLSATQLSLQKVLVSLERVFEILDTRMEGIRRARDVHPTVVRSGIRFQGVSFSYDGTRDVLHDLNLSIPAGRIVALVGRSGAGKSTIASLLMRFYDPARGSIWIDHREIRALPVSELRRWMTLVPQDVFLFSTSIEENIRLGFPQASASDVVAAARLADADAFIRELPDRYASKVGERGLLLSGGQRQRIGIARALLRHPQLIILDEAVSAVDGAAEKSICDTVRALNREQGITALVIAHRLSTIVQSDVIYMLEGGRIAGAGTHSALLVSCPAYRTLIDFQYGAPADVSPDAAPWSTAAAGDRRFT